MSIHSPACGNPQAGEFFLVLPDLSDLSDLADVTDLPDPFRARQSGAGGDSMRFAA
jgi:hypothetical protein